MKITGNWQNKDNNQSDIYLDQINIERMWGMLLAAWLIAMTASLGALFIGEVMGQTPCVLCWHQRIFMFPLAIILGLACLNIDFSVVRYALPLAVLGTVAATWHVITYLEILGPSLTPCRPDMSCTGAGMTIFDIVPIPLLSLGSFFVILVLLGLVARSRRS